MQNTCIMPTLQIRDVPQELYDRLVESAEINRRSLTQQAIVLLEEATDNDLNKKKQRKMEALERIKALRPHFSGISTEDIVASIREDRDR
jgi:hypothetical protein